LNPRDVVIWFAFGCAIALILALFVPHGSASSPQPIQGAPNSTYSLSPYGIPQGMSWDQSVQGQWCNSDGHAAEARAVAQTTGITFEAACTKLWAIDQ
jgi:hypothetical protein